MKSPLRKKIFRASPRSWIAAFLLLAAAAMPRTGRAQSPQIPPAAYPQNWEYRVVPLGSIDGTTLRYGAVSDGASYTKPFEDGLTKFGRDGWELVAIDVLGGNKVAIFKRPGTAPSR